MFIGCLSGNYTLKVSVCFVISGYLINLAVDVSNTSVKFLELEERKCLYTFQVFIPTQTRHPLSETFRKTRMHIRELCPRFQ